MKPGSKIFDLLIATTISMIDDHAEELERHVRFSDEICCTLSISVKLTINSGPLKGRRICVSATIDPDEDD
jgi:hypothetical protein